MWSVSVAGLVVTLALVATSAPSTYSLSVEDVPFGSIVAVTFCHVPGVRTLPLHVALCSPDQWLGVTTVRSALRGAMNQLPVPVPLDAE